MSRTKDILKARKEEVNGVVAWNYYLDISCPVTPGSLEIHASPEWCSACGRKHPPVLGTLTPDG